MFNILKDNKMTNEKTHKCKAPEGVSVEHHYNENDGVYCGWENKYFPIGVKQYNG